MTQAAKTPEPAAPLTPAMFQILLALADGEKHGYAIMQQTTQLSDGRFRMGPGTLYTTIQRLLELSLIEEIAEKSAPESRRRYYRLTRNGRALLEIEINRLGAVLQLASEKRLWPQHLLFHPEQFRLLHLLQSDDLR